MLNIALVNRTVQIYLPTKASGGPVDTALVKVGGRWRHRKSGGPPVGWVEPWRAPVGPVAYSAGPQKMYLICMSAACFRCSTFNRKSKFRFRVRVRFRVI